MKFQTFSFKNIQDISEYAASFIRDRAEESIRNRGYFTLVLSGGKTPKPLYELLSGPRYREKINWENVYVFWSDERYVSKDQPSSNYKMALESILSKAPLPEANVFPIPGPDVTESPYHASKIYEQTIHRFFKLHGEIKNFPSYDVILLGMGEDGHTASLYPGNPALGETIRWVRSVNAPDYAPVKQRVTLTLPVLNSAKNVLFLISGVNKRDVLKKVIWEIKQGAPTFPASMIRPAGNLLLLTDILEEDEKPQ